jgi:phosphatidylinositol glycan class B
MHVAAQLGGSWMSRGGPWKAQPAAGCLAVAAAMSHRRRSNATGPPPPEGVGDSSTAQASSTEKERPDPPSVLGSERRVLALALAFRAANALLVRTYFNPDEHWQCLEVAHRIVFG